MVGTCKSCNRVPSAFTMQSDILNEQSVFFSSPRTLPPSLFLHHTPPHVPCHNSPIHTKSFLKFFVSLGKVLCCKFYGTDLCSMFAAYLYLQLDLNLIMSVNQCYFLVILVHVTVRRKRQHFFTTNHML